MRKSIRLNAARRGARRARAHRRCAHAEDLVQIYQRGARRPIRRSPSPMRTRVRSTKACRRRARRCCRRSAPASATTTPTAAATASARTRIGSPAISCCCPTDHRPRPLAPGPGHADPVAVQLGQYRHACAAAARQAASADSNYDAASQDLFVRTATAYFGVLTAQDQLTFAQANEKALARQLDQAEQRFEVGLSAITDVHDARANHDSSVAQVIQAQNTVDNAREAREPDHRQGLRRPEETARAAAAGQARARRRAGLGRYREQAESGHSRRAQQSVDAAEYNIGAQRSGHLSDAERFGRAQRYAGWGEYDASRSTAQISVRSTATA